MKQRRSIKDMSLLTPVMLWILLCQPPVFAQEVDSAAAADAGASATSTADATDSTVQPEAAEPTADPATAPASEVSAPSEIPASNDQPTENEGIADPATATASEASAPSETPASDDQLTETEATADPATATASEPSTTPEKQESTDQAADTEDSADPATAGDSAPDATASSDQTGDAETSISPSETAPPVAPAAVDSAPVAAPAGGDAVEADPTPQSAEADAAAESKDNVAPAESKSSGAAAAAVAAAALTTVSTSDLLTMFNKQQAQLDEQKKEIVEQRQLLASLQSQQADKSRQQEETIANQARQIDDQRKSMQSMQTQIDQFSQVQAQDLSDADIELRARLQSLESSIQASEDSATTAFDEESFPGSTTIPGTNAAVRFGGFVKMNVVETFDPLGSLDRFIAGTIPVPQQSQSPRTSMTVSQSRLNWDLRDRTKLGVMRAFIEGDFAGDGDDDTFRLRHAYGQFRDILAGKTWTTFMDVDASPEELDFEGINGRINVRQPQLRYFPKLGDNWDVMVSIEDPNPEITGGTAISRWPDIVVSTRRTWFDRWHIKTSGVLRQLTGTWDEDLTGETDEQITAWGVSVSGKTSTQIYNKLGLNNWMFQLNVGQGIGRYINDLNTVGGEDAVFDSTGNMETLPVFAGYVAYQHWWKENMRSTLNLSWVDVDNKDFELPEAYKRTLRGAINVIWSPIPRIDIGGELIWGKRENKDGEDASATQIQVSTKYRF
jgi:hypothetical protein